MHLEIRCQDGFNDEESQSLQFRWLQEIQEVVLFEVGKEVPTWGRMMVLQNWPVIVKERLMCVCCTSELCASIYMLHGWCVCECQCVWVYVCMGGVCVCECECMCVWLCACVCVSVAAASLAAILLGIHHGSHGKALKLHIAFLLKRSPLLWSVMKHALKKSLSVPRVVKPEDALYSTHIEFLRHFNASQ